MPDIHNKKKDMGVSGLQRKIRMSSPHGFEDCKKNMKSILRHL
jgi:hypothetical protein